MRHLKEISRSPSRKPPRNIQNILSQIKLFEVYPKIFAVVIKDDKLRARVFMRYQEFYESDSDTFRGKGFKWTEFVNYYKQKTKNDILSYHEDWTGYNLPCDSIESCISVIPDINFFDLIMFSIVDTIKSKVGNDKFYLIGIDQADGEDKSLIEHELAHGLWFSSPQYKAAQLINIDELPDYVDEPLRNKISGMGYGPNVIDDEIQAYLSTGIISPMNRIKDIKKYQIIFRNTFNKYASNMSAKQIPIDWSTDLNA
jgi:hypothetical protein